MSLGKRFQRRGATPEKAPPLPVLTLQMSPTNRRASADERSSVYGSNCMRNNYKGGEHCLLKAWRCYGDAMKQNNHLDLLVNQWFPEQFCFSTCAPNEIEIQYPLPNDGPGCCPMTRFDQYVEKGLPKRVATVSSSKLFESQAEGRHGLLVRRWGSVEGLLHRHMGQAILHPPQNCSLRQVKK